MNYKSRLILLFILVAIIPIIALSAVSAYSVLKFRDSISNMYSGVVNNQEVLQQASSELQNTKMDLLQYGAVGASSTSQTAAISGLGGNVESLMKAMDNYKKISSLPSQELLALTANEDSDASIKQITLDEERLLSDINSKSFEYHSKIRDFIILSKDPGFTQVKQNSVSQILVLYDKLNASYKDLVKLNTVTAKITYDTSNNVVRLAYLYLGIAASISAGCATAAAILVSKRVILGDLVNRTKIELVETTIRDLVGEGADLILHQLNRESSSEDKHKKKSEE